MIYWICARQHAPSPSVAGVMGDVSSSRRPKVSVDVKLAPIRRFTALPAAAAAGAAARGAGAAAATAAVVRGLGRFVRRAAAAALSPAAAAATAARWTGLGRGATSAVLLRTNERERESERQRERERERERYGRDDE